MKKLKDFIIQIPNLLLIIMFTIIIIFFFFYRTSIYYDMPIWLKIIVFITAVFLMLGFYLFCLKYTRYEEKHKNKKKLALILVIIGILINCFLAFFFLRVQLNNGDLSMLYGTASRIVNIGIEALDPSRISYFEGFPHQMFPLFFFEIIVKLSNLIHISAANLFPFINLLCILISILFTYKCINLKFGEKYQVPFLILCLFAFPLFLFIPIFYTDTLSMPFVIAAYYFYLKSKDKLWYLLACCLCLGIGANLKITVLILLIAIITDMIFHFQKGMLKKIFLLIILSLCFYKGIGFIGNTLNPLKIDVDKGYPKTHWFMMGLGSDNHSYGGYYWEDFQITKAENSVKKQREKNIEVIKNRLKNYGATGYLNFLIHKLEVTWMDGAFVSPYKYQVYQLHKNIDILKNTVIPNGTYFTLFISIIEISHVMIILFMYLSFVFSYKKRENKLFIPSLSILGTMIFFMFWETRSRYILNMYPLFLITVIYALDCLQHEKKLTFNIKTILKKK